MELTSRQAQDDGLPYVEGIIARMQAPQEPPAQRNQSRQAEGKIQLRFSLALAALSSRASWSCWA